VKLTCNWLFISPVFCIASITVMHYCSLVVGSLSSVHVCNRCMALLLCVWSQNTYHEYSRPGGRTTAANNQTVLCISRNAAHTFHDSVGMSSGILCNGTHTHTYTGWATWPPTLCWLSTQYRLVDWLWDTVCGLPPQPRVLRCPPNFVLPSNTTVIIPLVYCMTYIYIYIYIYISVCVWTHWP